MIDQPNLSRGDHIVVHLSFTRNVGFPKDSNKANADAQADTQAKP